MAKWSFFQGASAISDKGLWTGDSATLLSIPFEAQEGK
jgi:hypothetical protein